jgi:threonylcarbamoyladenosine tRNA methylthiotransferase MtaB
VQGTAYGYGESYVPVRFKADGALKNTVRRVKLLDLKGEGENMHLIGELNQ